MMDAHENATAQAVVVGAGLAGLVATCEMVAAGVTVTLVDAQPDQDFGGQAFWSLGGLFMVDTPEQRRTGLHDSAELAWSDWEATAGFDRDEDHWPRHWAKSYIEFAAGPMRGWLHNLGMRWFPSVGWAERGGQGAYGPGNTLPRFHITWGTGPGVLAPFVARVREAMAQGRVHYLPRHRVRHVDVAGGRVQGVSGEVLAESPHTNRGQSATSRVVGDFSIAAPAVLIATGGVGGNTDMVRTFWPTATLGPAPEKPLLGVPAFVDGSGLQAAADAGVRLINTDRMWHYTEGVRNFSPIWPSHGIRILPGPSSLWLDSSGLRLPPPWFPGNDTLGTLQYLRHGGHEWSWFVANAQIAGKEYALSGSEQNPDLTGKRVSLLAKRLVSAMPGPLEAFVHRGEDFLSARTVTELASAMARIDGGIIDTRSVVEAVKNRDAQVSTAGTKDPQVQAMRSARHYIGERLIRTAPPAPLTASENGPLIAVRLRTLTRKSLGGIETDLSGRAFSAPGVNIAGLYAAGEATGFGGGGYHGYRALEGTFLGGCLFTGLRAGRAMARDLR